MKSTLLTLAVCLMATLTAGAAPITREQARLRAEQFLKDKSGQKQLNAVTNRKRLAPRTANAQGQETYYVFDRGQDGGFVIVSGDDRTEGVLGYCDNGHFDHEQLPPALQEWLADYSQQIARIQAGAPVISDMVPTHPAVAPMMKSKWSQGDPYNRLCPLDGGSRSVTGCVATAMAQLLYYNREKSVDETQATIPAYDTWTKKIRVQSVPAGSPIDWEHMVDTYGSATELQKNAVAQLMLYCGAAAKMDYTSSSSGAQSHDAYLAFVNVFGYGSKVKWYDYSNVTSDTEWDRIVYAEMAAGRPIYISGSNSGGGHAFIAHGYDGNLRYYINWGWGGQSDGYYYLTNLTPGDGQGIGGSASGYNGYREIFVGIEPDNYQAKTMSFSDATVRQACLSNWDSDGDGKLTYGEAAEVKSLGTVFQGKAIKTFSELYYFTGLTAIDDDAFNGCTALTTLRLPKTLTSIGERAFKDCKKLTQVDFFASMKEIGAEAFCGCEALKSIDLPDELTALQPATFKDCVALTEMELPVCMNLIGDEAFSGCKGLTDFTVKTFHPEHITMGQAVFANASLGSATLHVQQGMKAFFSTAGQWSDFGTIAENRERSGGNFATLEAGQTYYLYHVGTGQYLTKGEAWGTQAVVGSEPMRFKVNHASNMPEGIYYLTSPDTGKTGSYLFRTNTDSNVGKGVQAAFVDGTSLTASARWHIEAAGDKVYTIQTPDTDASYAEGKYWGVQTDHASEAASPTYGVYSDVDYSSHAFNCQWQFVPYSDEAAAVYEEARTLGNLLTMAKKRTVRHDSEQAVYDNMESTTDQLRNAQRTLRRKMSLIDFADPLVYEACVSSFDQNTDGEVSISEAAAISELSYAFGFYNNTALTSFDEFRYFSAVPDIYGNTFEGCTKLRSVVLPEGLAHIYYRAFYGCKSLTAINIPAYVTLIGENCFYGCSALREVTVDSPEPGQMELGSNIFGGVPLAECTLYVPFGSKALYEAAPVWKQFGTIVERRSHSLPRFSPIEENKPGYIYNIGTRKLLTMGEAYGTQTVVGVTGRLYQWRRNTAMPEGTYYLYDEKSQKVVFRTATDSKVGEGVKACFGDGSLSASAYWTVDSLGENVYRLHVPGTDANYAEGEYLGTSEHHASNAASPTSGVYWDVDGGSTFAQWAFVTEDDLNAARRLDQMGDELAQLIATAKARETDVSEEETVYNRPESTADELRAAIASIRGKLHFINFSDERTKAFCVQNWDVDGDNELHESEVASETDISQVFRKSTALHAFEELRYFTSLTSIPDSAFLLCSNLTTISIPQGVEHLGKHAFMRCNALRNVVILNTDKKLERADSYVPTTACLFVPAGRMADYEADEVWSTMAHLSVYTGQPVVTATAQREYGRTAAAIKITVDGAPIEGEPAASCALISDRYAPAGTYPITIEAGTVTTPSVDYREGTFTVVPAPMTVTAKSYTRQKGQPNPEFELTFGTFRNRETAEVFSSQPVAVCEADELSPAGEYEIRVEGGEAQNYVFTYVSGTLTVTEAQGIATPVSDTDGSTPIYTIDGRRVEKPKKGLYIRDKKVVVVN